MKLEDIYARTNNVCLVFLSICAGTMALIYMKPVMIPLIFSIFAYSILTPVVQWVRHKTNLPNGVAIFFSLLGLFLILILALLILISSVENFVEGAPKYKESLTGTLHLMEKQLDRFDLNLDLNQLTSLVQSSSFLSFAQRFTGEIFYFLGNLVLVFVFTLFMMTGDSRHSQRKPLMEEVLQKISLYVGAKFFLSITTGTLVGLVLLIFGVELAFIFALLTILFNFIPTVGSMLSVLLPLPVVFLQYQFSLNFFLVLSLTGAIQFTVGNVIEPKVVGESMDLHPITTLICLVFWGMVWGVAGLFLAVPITAVLRIVFARIEATKGLSEILAGRITS